MNPFKIIHAFFLQSAQKLMGPNTIYSPQKEAEVDELREFASRGSCEETVPLTKAEQKKVEKASPVMDPVDDITVVPGIGKKTLPLLAEVGITTKSGLKDKLEDAKVKEILGMNFEKIQAYFTASPTV
jgi:predicted flap endonuclease-1-like 5' DNA nuclease